MIKTDKSISKLLDDVSTKKDILYEFEKYVKNKEKFYHIVSLNPENLVLAQEDDGFYEILRRAQLKICDGVGTVVAGRILKGKKAERITGVDLMSELIKISTKMRIRIMFIGGRDNLADKLSNCYNEEFKTNSFMGVEGLKNARKYSEKENEKLISIVSEFKPHLIFVAFGSPYQERWIWNNREKLNGIFCMGVGGGFDFLGKKVPRAPYFLRKMGLEWFFRLLVQPWRIKRQLRLAKFIYLVIQEYLCR